jgi:hypothetical protein
MMQRLTGMICGAAAIALMAGCTDTYGHRDSFGVAVGYDGYYDDYYGPFTGGYWDNDGFFYYYDSGGHRHRDSDHHFRHDSAQGYHAVHGGQRDRDRDHARDRDHDRDGRGG